MALPEGVTTCTVTAGVPVTHTGAPVKAFVSIEPSVFLVHTATGTPLVDFLEELSINEGVAGQFTLPHTDQAGFQDENGNAYTNWYYTARISYSTPSKAKTKAPKIKVFQLVAGQTIVDLDALPGGAPALPYTTPIATVTSLNGRTGPVELLDADLPERLSDTSLSATILEQVEPVTLASARDYSARATERQLAKVVRTGTVVDSFNGKTTWTMSSGTGSVTVAARELVITTTASATVTAKRVVALDLTDRFISFDVYRDANLNTFGVKLATGTDADTNGWRVDETVTKINVGEWYTYTLPLAQAVVLGTATAADRDDVQAIRFVVKPNAATDTTLKIRNLRSHPNATPPAVHFQFDDARKDTYTVAYPILKAAGYTGGIAVEFENIGNANRCTVAELKEMYAEGWSMYGHHSMQSTDTTDAVYEGIFQQSQAFNVTHGFARGHAHWVWPGGARDAAKEALGRKYWATTRKVNAHHLYTAPYVFERVDPSHVYIQTGTTLASAKSRVDAVVERGGAVVFVFHTLQNPKVAQEDWTPEDFTALVAYAKEKGLVDTNFDQLYGSYKPGE